MDQAFAEGYAAYFIMDDNPYAQGTVEYISFENGCVAAREELDEYFEARERKLWEDRLTHETWRTLGVEEE